MRYRQVCIEGLSYVVPTEELQTQEIENELSGLYPKLGMKPGWLQSVTGIRSRRFWPRHLRPSDVATNAAKGVLQNMSALCRK